MATKPIELVARNDRAIVVAMLVTVAAASWAWILTGAAIDMGVMEGMDAPMNDMAASAAWSPRYALLMFVMWWAMMTAMMLPSAAPMILLYARLDRRQRDLGAPVLSTGTFAAGYLVAWACFSLAALLAQRILEQAGLLSPAMTANSGLLAGMLLVVAGLYQLTPLKRACLQHCRSPIGFLSRHWRNGRSGAFVMGVEHGTYCVGCCWVLMALLFVGGVMNLLWIAGLALLVLLEKLAPAGHWIGRAAGLGLIGWGGYVLASG